MEIFKENAQVNKLDDLDQAILLFKVQNKYIEDLEVDDCNTIVDLLEELKVRKNKEMDNREMERLNQIIIERHSRTVDEGTMGFTDYVTKKEPIKDFVNRVTKIANDYETNNKGYKVRNINYLNEDTAVLVTKKTK